MSVRVCGRKERSERATEGREHDGGIMYCMYDYSVCACVCFGELCAYVTCLRVYACLCMYVCMYVC